MAGTYRCQALLPIRVARTNLFADQSRLSQVSAALQRAVLFLIFPFLNQTFDILEVLKQTITRRYTLSSPQTVYPVSFIFLFDNKAAHAAIDKKGTKEEESKKVYPLCSS